jgi:hypothetical protein
LFDLDPSATASTIDHDHAETRFALRSCGSAYPTLRGKISGAVSGLLVEDGAEPFAVKAEPESVEFRKLSDLSLSVFTV